MSNGFVQGKLPYCDCGSEMRTIPVSVSMLAPGACYIEWLMP